MGIENLLSKSLKDSLEESRVLQWSLGKAGSRLQEMDQRLCSLKEVRAQPIGDPLTDVCGRIDRALVPTAAVLKLFDVIHEIEKSIFDPQSNLPGCLVILKWLEESLRFLEGNCGMAIQWLGEIIEYLEEDHTVDEHFISCLKKSLGNLQELVAGEEIGSLDGWLLETFLDRLENEFRRLLTENSIPMRMPTPPLPGQQEVMAPLLFGITETAILGKLIENNRLDNCIEIYVEVRRSNLRASLQALNLDYLENSVSVINDFESTKVYISQWGRHLEFAVKHLFETEHKLCNDVFERKDVCNACFANIVQEGFLGFLHFGRKVTETKKDPEKLLNLLDIFATLRKLQPDIIRLFGGTPCAEIRSQTRGLLKTVIEGSCQIFRELLTHIKLQQFTPPPHDCGVHTEVTLITDYASKLLGSGYKSILTSILNIEREEKKEQYEKNILTSEIMNFVNAIELNLVKWSDGYKDPTAPCLFLMNNHWHLCKYLKGTNLGGTLVKSWLKKHEPYKEIYLQMFLGNSWAKLPTLLSREGLGVSSGGRATAWKLVKQRLENFNQAFDIMHRKQSDWVIVDPDVREKLCQDIIQTIVPVYRSFMEDYRLIAALVGQGAGPSKYVKYTATSLEGMLKSLFLPKLVKDDSFSSRV